MKPSTAVRVGTTGHRPARAGDIASARQDVRRAVDELVAAPPGLIVVTGGAIGYDHWIAQECIARGLQFELVLPCRPQLFTKYWNDRDRVALRDLCNRAST